MLSDNGGNIHHRWVLFVPIDLSPSLSLSPILSLLLHHFLPHPPCLYFAILLYLNKHVSLG